MGACGLLVCGRVGTGVLIRVVKMLQAANTSDEERKVANFFLNLKQQVSGDPSIRL